MNEVSVDWRVLLAAGVTTMLTGVLVGVLPALSSASVNPQASLQDASRGTVGGALRRRARAGLVVAEVALAVAITTGAVLLLRSFVSVTNVNPGFETVAAADVADEPAAAPDEQHRSPRLLPRLLRAHGSAARRGVGRRHHARAARQHVGDAPRVQIEGRPVPAAELPEVQFRRAMHNYFETMGIPIRRGRNFDPNDGPTAPPVAVINETMAAQAVPEPGSDRPARAHRARTRPARGRRSSA